MIELFDGWWIDLDAYSYILKKRLHGKSKKGEAIERNDIIGYYGTLEGALKALGRELVKRGVKEGSHTLSEALSVVSETRKQVYDLIDEKVKI